MMQAFARSEKQADNLVDVSSLHAAIDDDIRTVTWRSNCAGEIFADDGSEAGLRIGHFQGDAALAAFVVAAHQAQLEAASAGAGKRPGAG